jgi:hypothetical protein
VVDGVGSARWRLFEERSGANLRVEPFRRLSRWERADVGEEATRLATFLTDDAGVRIEITAGLDST